MNILPHEKQLQRRASWEAEFSQKSKISVCPCTLPLAIEIGRFNGLPEEKTICFLCDLDEIEKNLLYVFTLF